MANESTIKIEFDAHLLAECLAYLGGQAALINREDHTEEFKLGYADAVEDMARFIGDNMRTKNGKN